MAYTEKGSVEALQRGETVQVRGIGNSMTPLLTSGQVVTVKPVTEETVIRKGDIVIVKVNARVYMHLVKGIKGDQFVIGNNHGHVNGTVTRSSIYGKVQRNR